MKKSVIFLINGLGIEKPGSYSISIDQCMPKLARTKETSYFTTAVINSLESRSAYESFFLGNPYQKELQYIKDNILNDKLGQNPTYQSFVKDVQTPDSKIHVFLEPNNERVVEEINDLINSLSLDSKKEVYLHLLLTQQTIQDYNNLIGIINYIKFHINSHITVGFVMGKEFIRDNLSKDEINVLKKMLFLCSTERWTETEKKLNSLKENNIRPCVAPGFCALNTCNITNHDVILFFNTRRTSYDSILQVIYDNCEEMFKTKDYTLPVYSLIHLDSKYNIPYFSENIVYDNSLSNMLSKCNKKALIITDQKDLKLLNFLANGLNYVNNPSIQFMIIDEGYLNSSANMDALINQSAYDLIIFDFDMDVSSTVNHLKEQLGRIDNILGLVADTCVNKHSLFITSLYGLRKDLPLADYNSEIVTIDYEMQIPIFFFDYTYPRSKYMLFPGETNTILQSAIKCIWPEGELDSLIGQRGIINNLLSAFRK